jgi:hypothetical protein
MYAAKFSAQEQAVLNGSFGLRCAILIKLRQNPITVRRKAFDVIDQPFPIFFHKTVSECLEIKILELNFDVGLVTNFRVNCVNNAIDQTVFEILSVDRLVKIKS